MNGASNRTNTESIRNDVGSSRDPVVLLSAPLSMFGAKAEIAALEKGIEWKREFVPFSLRDFYAPKSPEVLRINPKAQVPVLIHGSLEIFDSTQIFEYLETLRPSPPLWPLDVTDRARARLLELKSDEVFFPDVANCMPHRRAALGEPGFRESVERIHRYFEDMDRLLADRDHLVGKFSYADIAFFAAQFFARFLGQSASADLENLEGWRERMRRRESVRTVMGAMADYLEANGVKAAL